MQVFVILKNADFTEGIGPMKFNRVCSSLEKAKEYLNSKPEGIYGAKPPKGITFADWCMSGQDGGWGGYDVLAWNLDDDEGVLLCSTTKS